MRGFPELRFGRQNKPAGSHLETVRGEVLAALQAAKGRPLNRRELLTACETAVGVEDISIALNALKRTGDVQRAQGGGWRFIVADAFDPAALPRPAAGWAGLTCHACGTSLEDCTASEVAEDKDGHHYHAVCLQARTLTPADEADPLARLRELPKAHHIAEPARKASALRQLAAWPALDGEVADFLLQIAQDLEGLAA